MRAVGVKSTEGEDLEAVKEVEDNQGLEAWCKILHRRAPRSMARAVRLVGLVASPPKIPDLAKVDSEIRK